MNMCEYAQNRSCMSRVGPNVRSGLRMGFISSFVWPKSTTNAKHIIPVRDTASHMHESHAELGAACIFFFFFSLLLFSFWTSRGHRCRLFPPPGSCLQFLSRIGSSNPTARRFFIEWCQLITLSRFPQVNFCTTKKTHELIRVCTRWDSNSRN